MSENLNLVAVYGSLRTGFGNHRIISSDSESELKSTEVVNIPFGMISWGSFPALLPSKENHDITIEIYAVSDFTYGRIEILEGYPRFYNRTPIKTSLGEIDIYFIEEPFEEAKERSVVVESGDWTAYKKQVLI